MDRFDEFLDKIRLEIDDLRRRHASLYREKPTVQEVVSHWTLLGKELRWHVALEDVIEPDVDIEIAPPVIIVRARPLEERQGLILVVLPVPREFDPIRPRIRCQAGFLEIQLSRSTRGEALR